MKSITLSSGNIYYFEGRKAGFLPFGFLISQDNTFKGGFLGKEAERKYAAFSKLANVEIQEQVTYDISNIKLQEFADKLGSVSSLFIKYFFKEVNDKRDCDGTSSNAQSCDDRNRYYKTVGIERAFKSSDKFLLGLFIANHLSIFGVNNFRLTFFRGKDNPSKDDELNSSEIFMKNVYDNCGFKAPAAYVKALCGE